MGKSIQLIYCLCGELMKKEEGSDKEIHVCWKCQCNTEEELKRKKSKKKSK